MEGMRTWGGNGGNGTIALTHYGQLNIQYGNIVIGADAANLPGTGTISLSSSSYVIARSITVDAGGTLKSDASSTINFVSLNLTSGSTLTLNGVLHFDVDSYASTPRQIVASNFDLPANGTLEGNGASYANTITGNFTNDGDITDAVLTVDGNYTQDSTDVFSVPSGGFYAYGNGGFGAPAMTIDGSATLGGTLDLSGLD